jgi:hypothetical protein
VSLEPDGEIVVTAPTLGAERDELAAAVAVAVPADRQASQNRAVRATVSLALLDGRWMGLEGGTGLLREIPANR